MKEFFMKTLAVITLILPGCALASYDITPVRLDLSQKDITSLELTNNNQYTTYFQIDLVTRVMQGGKEVLKESKDLDISPRQFKLTKDKSQMVRVKKGPSAMHTNYVLLIKELPHKEVGAKQNTGVKFIQQFTVPLSMNGVSPQ